MKGEWGWGRFENRLTVGYTELYLLAFGPLRSVFSAHELNAMADAMAERGLRLRRGLDEALEGWVGIEQRDADSSGESGDEIEESARELRRLMPY